MPHYDFDEDILTAKETEREIARLLRIVFGAKIRKFNDTNEYDILAEINKKEYTFEVKEDFTCERTGNVVVEFECRGKPSGIQVSKANCYIYKVHTNGITKIFLFKTDTIKEKIANREYFRIVNGGDIGSNSMNYLFKYDTFIKNGQLIGETRHEIESI